MEPTDRLLTIAEVRERLGVARSTVARMLAEGSIPVVQLRPQAPRIRESDLERFIADRTAVRR